MITLDLTPRFIRAAEYARQNHPGCRKGTEVPYLAHLFGVASLVLEENGHLPFPVTEDMAIAALLHDAVEDAGGVPRLHDIEANYGQGLAKIVAGCSDSFEEDSDKKSEWEERKAQYIERLWKEPLSTLLVSAADKLYNARAILEDPRVIGPQDWNRLKRGRDQQIRNFCKIVKVYEQRGPDWRIVKQLERTVEELRQISE